jgi:hypothetical protein
MSPANKHRESKNARRLGTGFVILAAMAAVLPVGIVGAGCWNPVGGNACDGQQNTTHCTSSSGGWYCAWTQQANGSCSYANPAQHGASTKQVYFAQCIYEVRVCGSTHGECDISHTFVYTRECSTSSGSACQSSGGGGGGDEYMLPEDP